MLSFVVITTLALWFALDAWLLVSAQGIDMRAINKFNINSTCAAHCSFVHALDVSPYAFDIKLLSSPVPVLSINLASSDTDDATSDVTFASLRSSGGVQSPLHGYLCCPCVMYL